MKSANENQKIFAIFYKIPPYSVKRSREIPAGRHARMVKLPILFCGKPDL